MARESEMIRNGGGLIDVTLCDGFLYCGSVFSKSRDLKIPRRDEPGRLPEVTLLNRACAEEL